MTVNNAANMGAAGVITQAASGAFSGSTITENSILLGGASNAVSDTGVLAQGEIIVGDGATDPVRLAVGVNKQALVADSAEASGVKWSYLTGTPTTVFISTTTASASSSIDFTGLSSTYASYLFIFQSLAPASDLVDLWIRTSTDNGSTYDSGANDYGWAYSGGSASPANTSDRAAREGVLKEDCGNATNETTCGWLKLLNPSNSGSRCGWVGEIVGEVGLASEIGYSNAFGGSTRADAAVDAVRFMYSSGNISSGSISIYGIKAS